MIEQYTIKQGTIISTGKKITDTNYIVIKKTDDGNLVLHNIEYDTWIILTINEIKNRLLSGKWFIKIPEEY